MSKLLVIFHSPCDDGFGAAWAIHRAELAGKLPGYSGVEYVKGVYGFPPPDVKGRDVVLVDYCYPMVVMERLMAEANSVVVLDHHVSAMKDALAWVKGREGFTVSIMVENEEAEKAGELLSASIRSEEFPDLAMVFDMHRSGAAMAWDHFMREPRPALINYIQDRDLFTKKLPMIDEFTMGLRSHPMDFGCWDLLAPSDPGVEAACVNRLIGEGESILRYQKSLVDEAVRNSFWVTLRAPSLMQLLSDPPQPIPGKTHRIRAANVPGALASEVGEALAKAYGGISLTWFEGKSFMNYSLRSRGDNAPDVSVIAKAFGGGGHAKAAGFKSEKKVHIKGTEE